MKVLAICGSPRNNGNTAYLLENICNELNKRRINSKLLKLADYKIEMCSGCLICEETNCIGDCSIKDDMHNVIYNMILEADMLILGTPSYFDMPSGLLKNFLDRSNAILSKIIDKKYKYGLVVVGQSEITSLDSVCDSLRKYCNICEMDEVIKSPLKLIVRDIGEAEKNPEVCKLINNFVTSYFGKYFK